MLQKLNRALDHVRNNSATKDPKLYIYPFKIHCTCLRYGCILLSCSCLRLRRRYHRAKFSAGERLCNGGLAEFLATSRITSALYFFHPRNSTS